MDRSRSIQANSGKAAAALIQPSPPPQSTSFLAKNVSSIKQQQLLNRHKQLVAKQQSSIPPFKMERFKHVGSVVSRRLEERREDSRGAERTFLKKGQGKSVVKKGVDVKVGELMEEMQRGGYAPSSGSAKQDGEEHWAEAEEEEEESIYTAFPESTVQRHPLRLQREQEEKQAISTTSASSSPPHTARSSASSSSWPSSSSSSTPKNFIAANALSVIHAAPVVPPPPPAPQPLHSAFGRVPSYLTQRKAEMQAAASAAEAAKAAKAIPPGMRRVAEPERLATLERLRENAAAVERELMAMPLRIETASRKRHKAELEAKIKDIEQAIALFSKRTVYITVE